MMLAYLAMVAVAALGSAVVVDPNSSASWVGGAAALTLLVIAIGFNAGTLVRLRREIRETKAEQRNDQRVCNYQLSVLVDVLAANGVPVPGRFWDVPDEATLQTHERKRRRKMFGIPLDPDSDESGWMTSIFVGTVFAVLAAFALFLLAFNAFFLAPVKDLRADRQKDACVASLTADQFAAIVFQIQSVPGSDERTAYSRIAVQAARRIKDRETICADGKPDPFDVPVPESLLR